MPLCCYQFVESQADLEGRQLSEPAVLQSSLSLSVVLKSRLSLSPLSLSPLLTGESPGKHAAI